MRARPLVVGLIGGIGSGKSRVAGLFAQRGARVVSGDEAGHEALCQPDIREQVVKRWGTKVLDEHGRINRRQLGAIVFGDPVERRALETLVFPWIKERLRQQIATASADPHVTLIVLDAAVLLEAGWDDVCDRILFVEAPREQRLARLAEQRGWSPEEVAARERAQWPLTAKAGRADSIIDNSGSLTEVSRQVEQWLQSMSEHAENQARGSR